MNDNNSTTEDKPTTSPPNDDTTVNKVEEQPLRVRVQAPDIAQVKQQVKKFTSAQGANFHIGVQKAKRVGLTALQKMAIWLTPQNKQ